MAFFSARENPRLPAIVGSWIGARFIKIVALTAALIALLYINHKIFVRAESEWIVIPLFIAGLLYRAIYTSAERPVVRLWQALGCLSAIFALLHFPLMPIDGSVHLANYAYALELAMWVAALGCGIGCIKRPSLAVVPPAFLAWGEHFAVNITGLPGPNSLDVIALPEISVCIGLGLLTVRAARHLSRRIGADDASWALAAAEFAQLLVLLAISVHLANYFLSFYAKRMLVGPAFGWVHYNNPAYIFLAALQDNHIVFARWPAIVSFVFSFLDKTFIWTNVAIFIAQGMAIIAFFLPKRWLIILLLAYDVMHVSIIIAVGANFWPWIVLNLIIGAVVLRHDFASIPLSHRTIGALFVKFAPQIFSVATLGWYDTGANNSVFVQAVDDTGKRYMVSTNFFEFYSYPISHGDYGLPGAAGAFSTTRPNGGSYDYPTFVNGRTCNVPALTKNGGGDNVDPRFLKYLANYHTLAVWIQDHIGDFPYDWNIYHFYIPRYVGADFYRLDKHRVAAYIVRRKSACLSFKNGHLDQRIVSTAEERIDVK